jgi:UPF0716 protein FxsA
MPFLFFAIYPLAEIAAFILVGEAIGVLATLGLIVISSALGLIMLRDAGIMTALRLQRKAANPALILAEGGSRMLAGLLLAIPGFLTDVAALAILVRPLRVFLLGRLLKGALVREAPIAPDKTGPRPAPKSIDGDFRRIDP